MQLGGFLPGLLQLVILNRHLVADNHNKRTGPGRPRPPWRSGIARHQGGVIFLHRIYPLCVERFQSSHDLIEPKALLGKPEILKASGTIMALLLVAVLLLEWVGVSLEHKSGWGKTVISRPSSGIEDRGFLNTKRWARPDDNLILWLFVVSNAITPRSWRGVIVYLRLFRRKEATFARPKAAPCGRARY